MTNSYGLDVSYFEGKLKLVLRDIKNYTPDELARELARYSVAADKAVILEPEFNKQQAARIDELEELNQTLHEIVNEGTGLAFSVKNDAVFIDGIGMLPVYTTPATQGAEVDDSQTKSDAIKRFVSTMIGALEAGFVEDATPTLAEVHQFARHHIKDNYGIDTPSISDEWGEEVAAICAAEHLQPPQGESK